MALFTSPVLSLFPLEGEKAGREYQVKPSLSEEPGVEGEGLKCLNHLGNGDGDGCQKRWDKILVMEELDLLIFNSNPLLAIDQFLLFSTLMLFLIYPPYTFTLLGPSRDMLG